MRMGPSRVVYPEPLERHRRGFIGTLETRGYSKSSVGSYFETVGFFLRFLVSRGVEEIPAVTKETIRQYQLWLVRQRYSPSTLHGKLSVLRLFFRYLEKQDAILLNPCEGLVMPRIGERLPKQILSMEEVKRMFAVVDTQTPKGIRDRALLEVFYSTGIRLEEMVSLTVHDVDFRQGFLRVNHGKGGKDRIVPLGRKACAYVKEYLKKVRYEWTQADREERALWLNSHAPFRAMGKMAVTVMLKGYGLRAGLDQSVSPHVWRHTCATHLMLNGANIVYVQKLLGHRCLGTTQIYARASIADVVQAWRRGHPRSEGGRQPRSEAKR